MLIAAALIAVAQSLHAGVVEKGSRVCNSDRKALAPKNANYTLSGKRQIIIYAGGVSANDSEIHGNEPHVWMFRRVGGTWAPVTSSSEVRLANAHALSDGRTVSVRNRVATRGSRDYVRSGREFETSSSQYLNYDIESGQVTESQIALSFSEALDGQQYEFACEWNDNQSRLLIVYPARIATPLSRKQKAEVARYQALALEATKRKSTEDAVRNFELVFSIDPHHKQALKYLKDHYLRRASQLKRTGNIADANHMLASALRVDPSDKRVRASLTTGERQIEIEKYEILAIQAAETNDVEEAVRHFEMLWLIDPAHARAVPYLRDYYLLRGLEHLGDGQLDAAARVWENALRVDPHSKRVNAYLSHARELMTHAREIIDEG